MLAEGGIGNRVMGCGGDHNTGDGAAGGGCNNSVSGGCSDEAGRDDGCRTVSKRGSSCEM